MHTISKQTGVLFVLLALAVVGLVLSYTTRFAQGASISGTKTTIATTSTPTITNTAKLIFASSTNCDSRVITTTGSAAMLTFADVAGTVGGPTGIFGHLQPASTTTVYPSEYYGCDAVRAYSFTSQAITTSEAR